MSNRQRILRATEPILKTFVYVKDVQSLREHQYAILIYTTNLYIYYFLKTYAHFPFQLKMFYFTQLTIISVSSVLCKCKLQCIVNH